MSCTLPQLLSFTNTTYRMGMHLKEPQEVIVPGDEHQGQKSKLTGLPRARIRSKRLSNRVVCLSICLSVDKEILKQLKYAVILSEKGTITKFALFWEGHSAVAQYMISWGCISHHFLFLIFTAVPSFSRHSELHSCNAQQ